MKDLLLKFYVKAQILREDHGQDMVEYALVVGIIALGSIAIMTTVAQNVTTMWTSVGTAITNASSNIH